MSGADTLKPARDVVPPAGWRRADHWDPFEAYLGPFFEREQDGARELGLLVDDRHTNAQGVVHGGTLLTLADACLGRALWQATGGAPCVTVSQHSSFLAAASAGDLIACRAEVVRKSREIVFLRADFRVADKLVFTATAIWRFWPKGAT